MKFSAYRLPEVTFLLNQILKTEWGFEGFVVTDYTSINEMVDHGVVANEKEAGALAVNAGVDMDMQGAVYYKYLAQLIKEKKVSERKIDEAVRRILRVKFQLGLFDDPYRYSDVSRQEATLLAPEHLKAARDMARKSMVLLKNQGQTLPLSKDLKSIALIGPLANSQADLLGSWHAAGFAEDCVSLLSGLQEAVGANTNIMYAKACEIEGGDQSGFPSALAIASQADVIIAAVGEDWRMSGEAASRSNIDLPGHQEALIKALSSLGKPLVVVLMNGRPLALTEVHEQADALLETWYAGTMGGPAIADVLFGDYNPSGRLPLTFPRNVGQIPIHYDMKNTGRPMDPNDKYTSKYLDVPNTPLYPFGYGLSYTQFEYSDPVVNQSSFSPKEKNYQLK
jgi:beta-glucosidase